MADYDDDEFFDHSSTEVFVSENEEDEENPGESGFMRGEREASQITEGKDDDDDLYSEP